MVRLALLSVCVDSVVADVCEMVGPPPGTIPKDCGDGGCCVSRFGQSDQVCFDKSTSVCCPNCRTMHVCDIATQIACGCSNGEPTGDGCCDKNTEECNADPTSKYDQPCVKKTVAPVGADLSIIAYNDGDYSAGCILSDASGGMTNPTICNSGPAFCVPLLEGLTYNIALLRDASGQIGTQWNVAHMSLQSVLANGNAQVVVGYQLFDVINSDPSSTQTSSPLSPLDCFTATYGGFNDEHYQICYLGPCSPTLV